MSAGWNSASENRRSSRDIQWAIEEHGVCATEIHQITKLAEAPEEMAIPLTVTAMTTIPFIPLPVFVYISQEEFEARLAECPAAVIRLKWDEPIVREAVEADRAKIMARLRGDSSEPDEGVREPSAVYHLTRESIALLR